MPFISFGRYQIQRELSQDSSVTVYLARDPVTERNVALKVFRREITSDSNLQRQFFEQASIIAKFEHRGLETTYDFGVENDTYYLVTRFLEGGSLRDRLADGPLSLDETRRIFTQIATTLDALHKQSIVHRDLKPENILFDNQDNPVIIDLGQIIFAGDESPVIVGTPIYMSPEHILGDAVDRRSDIYSLGIIFFEMLTGERPFDSSSLSQLLEQQLHKAPPSILRLNPSLPSYYDYIIQRMLEKNPAKRYQTVAELVADLEIVRPLDSPNAKVSNAFSGTVILIGAIVVFLIGLLGAYIAIPDLFSADVPTPIEIAPATVPQADDRFGEMTISYPSYLRPVSSERIDVKLYIPPELASIEPVSLVRLPSTVTPTLKALNSHKTHILVSQQMAAVLTSPTFSVESIHPIQQQIKFDGSDTFWSWNITAPEALSTGILTLKIYKLYGVDADLTSIPPTWVGTIQVEVVQNTPTPSPTATATPQPTPTLGFFGRAKDSIADNSVTIVAGLLTLIGVAITAICGPIIVERWKQRQNGKPGNQQSIANMLQSAAIKKINNTDDVNHLKAWLFDEKRNKNRRSVVEAIEERIRVLDSTENLD